MGFWVFLSVCFFKVSGWNIVGEDFFPFFSFFSGVVKKTLWRPRVLRPAQNLPLKKTISHQSPRIQTRRCFVSRIRSTATIHRRKAGRGQPSKKGAEGFLHVCQRDPREPLHTQGLSVSPQHWHHSPNMGSGLLPPAPTSSPPSSLNHFLICFVKVWNRVFFTKKKKKKVLQITLHKIQQTVHCNVTQNRSREGAGWQGSASTTSAL